jgi:hypothetical protein
MYTEEQKEQIRASFIQEARADVLGQVHRLLDHRLENIRLYVDRPNPDKGEILSLVREIEAAMAKIHP